MEPAPATEAASVILTDGAPPFAGHTVSPPCRVIVIGCGDGR